MTLTSFTANGGTVQFTGTVAVAFTTAGQNLNSLSLIDNGAKTVTVAGALNVGGNLELQATQILAMGAGNLAVTGTTNAIAGALVGTITSTSGTQVFTGNFQMGSLTASSVTTSFAGATVTFTSFTANGGTVQFTGTVAVAFTTAGQNLNNLSLIDNGAKTVTVTGGLTLNGNLEVQANQILAMGANNLGVTGTTNAVAGGVGTITSTSGTQVFTGNFQMGSLTASSVTTSFAGATVTLTGFTANGGTVQFTGTVAVAFTTAGQNLNSLSLIDNGAKTVTVTGALNVGGNLEVQATQILAMGAGNLGVTGTTNAVAGGVGSITSTSGTQVFTGNFQMGSLTASSVTTSFAGATVTLTSFTANGGTVQFTGAGAQILRPNGQTFDTVSVVSPATVRWTGTATVGNLTVAIGATVTLDSSVVPGAVSLAVTAGDTLQNNGTFGLNGTGGTLTLQGSAASANYAGNDIVWGGQSLTMGDLIYGPGTSLSSGTTLTLNNAVTMTGGMTTVALSTVAVGTFTLSLGASSTFAGNVNLGGGTGQIGAAGHNIGNTGTITFRDGERSEHRLRELHELGHGEQ